jgi:hypothetical protein
MFFRHLVETLSVFSGDVFSAGWISECFLTGVLLEFDEIQDKSPEKIKTAIDNLLSDNGVDKLSAIPKGAFQSNDADGLHDILTEKLINKSIRDDLRCCAEALWQEPNQLTGFKDWVRSVLGNTLSATLLQTLSTLFPEIPEDSVFVDSFWDSDQLSIWISESEPGGCGVVTQMGKAYYDDPFKVLNVFAKNLQSGEYEKIDSDLFHFLEKVMKKEEMSTALNNIRLSDNHEDRKNSVSSLHRTLQQEGFILSHSFLTRLHSRVLKSGSSKNTDKELYAYLKQWLTYEDESGFEWPLIVIAYVLSVKTQNKDITADQIFEKICRIQNLLWPRGYTVRHSTLSFYNPFQQGVSQTERILGEKLLIDNTPQIILPTEDWLVDMHTELRNFGRVDLIFKDNYSQIDISKYITTIQLEPIDHMGLLLYPRLGGIRRVTNSLVIRVELAEYY